MKFTVVLLLVYTSVVPSAGLRCIECYYALDPSICKHTKDCGNNEQCYIREYVSEENLRVFDLNCVSDSICKSKMIGSGPPIVGKKKRSISGNSNEQMKCCDTDLCNGHLFDQSTTSLQTTLGTDSFSTTETMPTSVGCVDNFQCQLLLNHFNICSDAYISTQICPKTCNTCPVTVTTEITTTTDSCNDQHVCIELAKSINICSIPIISTKLCPRSCSMCGVSSVTSSQPTVSAATCTDHSDCKSLSKHVNICQDFDLATNLCPDFCKRCHANTTVTVTPTTGYCEDRDPSLCQYLDNAFHICNNETHIFTLECNGTCGTCKGSSLAVSKSTSIPFTTQPSQKITDTTQQVSTATSGVTETTSISKVTGTTKATSKMTPMLPKYTSSSVTQSTSVSCPPFPTDCPQGCATFGVHFCWICDYSLCSGSIVKSTFIRGVGRTTTSKNITPTSKITQQMSTSTSKETTTSMPTTQLPTSTSKETPTSKPTTQLPTSSKETPTSKPMTQLPTSTSKETPTSKPTTQLPTSTSKETPTSKPTTQLPTSTSKGALTSKLTSRVPTPTSRGFVFHVITPPITKQATDRLMTSSLQRHLTTTTSSAGCPTYPKNCPISCQSYDNNFCPICDSNLCKGMIPDPTACVRIFCVLNCGNPPVYKKDNNGCNICSCA